MEKVLIVEDEVLVGMALAASVRDAGHDACGPFAACEPALRAIEAGQVSGAILDVNLGPRGTSYPVARELARRHIPFVFLSAYPRASLDRAFDDVPLFQKPLADTRLRDIIEAFGRDAPPTGHD
jgi:DNA-binding response OmpR family regulator